MATVFPSWTCRIDRVICYCGHEIKPKAEGAILTTQGDCLRPLSCSKCGGHAIGVQSEFHGTIVFYGCNKPMFEKMLSWPEDAKTWVMLEALDFIAKAA